MVKDPELVLHNDSDNDEDHDADDGEVAQPSIAIPVNVVLLLGQARASPTLA